MDCGIFVYQIKFHVESFSNNNLVMQKKTLKCEPSTEILYVWDGVLKDDVNLDLLLDGVTIQQIFIFCRCEFKCFNSLKKDAFLSLLLCLFLNDLPFVGQRKPSFFFPWRWVTAPTSYWE